MNNLFRILNNQLELNDSIDSYDEVSFIRPSFKKDEKGTYKEKVSYLQYKGELEYPDSGTIGYNVEKIYEKCEHKEIYVFGSWYKCKDCNEFVLK